MRTLLKAEETDEERLARLRALAAQLHTKTDCPFMREKIEAILAGARASH